MNIINIIKNYKLLNLRLYNKKNYLNYLINYIIKKINNFYINFIN